MYTDRVSLAGLGPVTVKLGAIEEQTTNFDQFKEIDGVIGFTSGGDKNVFAQLVAAGACENVWALCINNDGAQSNGTLTIGGVDARLSTGPITYVPDVGRGFHSVQVQSFVLGNQSASKRGTLEQSVPVHTPAILDTGTNVLLLPPRLLKALGSAMCSDASLPSCGALWSDTCVALTEAEVDAYPDLTLVLDGAACKSASVDRTIARSARIVLPLL